VARATIKPFQRFKRAEFRSLFDNLEDGAPAPSLFLWKTLNTMSRFLRAALLLCFFASTAMAQKGYHIQVEAEGFQGDTVYLGYYLYDKEYLVDTAVVQNGKVLFEGDEPLPAGMYLVVFPPQFQFFQLLLPEKDQRFSVKTHFGEDMAYDLKFEGSKDNELFMEYVLFLRDQREPAQKLQQAIQAEENEKKRKKLEEELEALNKKVSQYQTDFIKKHHGTLAATFVKANMPVDIPDFADIKEDEERQIARWQYTKQHYFDNIELENPAMLRTPFLHRHIRYYLDKLTVQHPDSISASLDFILQRMKPAPETFKHYLVRFLNDYAASKIVGFDAVYVHLVDNYYAKGLATWTDEEQLQKILENADILRPLLIGKIAPDIKMETREGRQIALHEVDAPYTVLFFWDPDCGHCKKGMPDVIDFYKKFKDRGVEVFAVCTKFYNEKDKCWQFIDEREGMELWVNVMDPYHRSRYKTIYDIRSTPQIYILDKNKKILSKRIGTDQLAEVMEMIMKRDEERAAAAGE